MNLFLRHKTLFRVLLLLFFLYLFFIRIYHLTADHSSLWLLIEERASGYNARNKVLFGDWDSGGGAYQPFAYMPLANLILYGVFKFFSIGILQLRLPFVVLTCIALVLFYLLLKRRYGTPYGLLGLALLGLSYPMVEWNRSSLNENLFIFFIILILYLYQRLIDEGKPHYYFWLGFLLTIFILIKVSGVLFIFLGFVFLIRRIFKERDNSLKNGVLNLFFGFISGVVVCLGIFFFTEAYKYVVPFYRMISEMDVVWRNDVISRRLFYIKIFENTGVNFNNKAVYFLNLLHLSFSTVPRYIFQIEPVSFFVVLITLPLFLKKNKVNLQLEHLNMLWLLVGSLTYIQRGGLIYFKPLVFLFPSLLFLVVAFTYHILNTDIIKDKIKISKPYFIWVGLGISYCLFLTSVVIDVCRAVSILPWPMYRFSKSIFIEYLLALPSIIKISYALIITMIFLLPPLFFAYINQRIAGSLRITIIRNIIIAVIITFGIYSNFYIIRNIVFPKDGLRYTTVNFAKELNKLISKGSTVAVQREDIFRFAAYGTENKYIFSHDSTSVTLNDILELVKNSGAPYFCYASESESLRQEIWQRLSKIYPNAKIIGRYRLAFNDNLYFLNGLSVEMVDLKNKFPHCLEEKVIIK